jgi:hypothetical protein
MLEKVGIIDKLVNRIEATNRPHQNQKREHRENVHGTIWRD